jgi:hypothetical protein
MSMKESASSKPLMNKRGGTWCIGNGQVMGATSMCYEVSQTLNCMHDPMAILVVKEDERDSINNRNDTKD